MKINAICKNYFNVFAEVSNVRKNDAKTNALAVLKFLSLFTVVCPLIFGIMYALAGRCKPSKGDDKTKEVAKRTFIPRQTPTQNTPTPTPAKSTPTPAQNTPTPVQNNPTPTQNTPALTPALHTPTPALHTPTPPNVLQGSIPQNGSQGALPKDAPKEIINPGGYYYNQIIYAGCAFAEKHIKSNQLMMATNVLNLIRNIFESKLKIGNVDEKGKLISYCAIAKLRLSINSSIEPEELQKAWECYEKCEISNEHFSGLASLYYLSNNIKQYSICIDRFIEKVNANQKVDRCIYIAEAQIGWKDMNGASEMLIEILSRPILTGYQIKKIIELVKNNNILLSPKARERIDFFIELLNKVAQDNFRSVTAMCGLAQQEFENNRPEAANFILDQIKLNDFEGMLNVAKIRLKLTPLKVPEELNVALNNVKLGLHPIDLSYLERYAELAKLYNLAGDKEKAEELTLLSRGQFKPKKASSSGW